MTSFISGGQDGSFVAANRYSEMGLINLQPATVHSASKKASPLKPSNESLLEHYKYEKQSKGQLQGSQASNF